MQTVSEVFTLTPFHTGETGDRAKIEFAEKVVQEMGFARAGDSVIVTAGHTQLSGGTNMIRIISLD